MVRDIAAVRRRRRRNARWQPRCANELVAVESLVVVPPVVKVRLPSDGVDVSMERVVESCDEISEFPLDSSQDVLNNDLMSEKVTP
jgi:hypothetical protein